MKIRKWRLAVCMTLLALYTWLFIFAGADADPARKAAFGLQLSASITRIGPKLLLAAAFLLSAFLLGRVYCSFLCPAGLVQELFQRLGDRLGIRRLGFARKAASRTLLLLLSLFILCGIVFPASFFDPIGLFGRFALTMRELPSLLRPDGSENPLSLFTTAMFVASTVLLVVVPIFRGRWFCDRLCPVGALLGLASENSRATPTIDADKCVRCGQCDKICQTRCIDTESKRIDPSRCVVCLDCFAACKFDAITFGGGKGEEGERRSFFKNAAVAAAFIAARPLAGRLGGSKVENAVAPPGSVGLLNHHNRCITCQACVPACPVGIIRPIETDLRPVLDYDRGYCQYNCQACAWVCPAGVFVRQTLEEKQATRIAATTLELSRCVVVLNGTSCGACAEVCPTHAVIMVEQEGDLPTLPDFETDFCIGCGACYHVCPAQPRAFTIEGLAVHEVSRGVRLEGHAGGADSNADGTKAEEYEVQDFPF